MVWNCRSPYHWSIFSYNISNIQWSMAVKISCAAKKYPQQWIWIQEAFHSIDQIFWCRIDIHHYKNSQENNILERIHWVVGSMLNTKYLANFLFGTVDSWIEILMSIAYAVLCSYHSTLKAAPRYLVFGRRILLDINFQPNYKEIWIRKQKLINYNNKRENTKRVQHD